MNNVKTIYDIANLNDIPKLVRLRILYMIDYAAEHKISRIDLMATDEGYHIYKKLGFEDKVQKYKDMRLVVVNQ